MKGVARDLYPDGAEYDRAEMWAGQADDADQPAFPRFHATRQPVPQHGSRPHRLDHVAWLGANRRRPRCRPRAGHSHGRRHGRMTEGVLHACRPRRRSSLVAPRSRCHAVGARRGRRSARVDRAGRAGDRPDDGARVPRTLASAGSRRLRIARVQRQRHPAGHLARHRAEDRAERRSHPARSGARRRRVRLHVGDDDFSARTRSSPKFARRGQTSRARRRLPPRLPRFARSARGRSAY